MKILGIELDFDFADADDLERYEKALPKTQEDLSNIKWNEQKASLSVRQFCDVIFLFFDEIFGDGTSQKMFNGKRNYQKCLNAFKEIMDAKKSQDAEIDNSLEYLEQYSPDRVKRS
jgi:hypothetical protein